MQVSAKVLANRTARRQADAARRSSAILAKAFTAVDVEETAVVDYAGRVVRTLPCTKEEVAAFLRGNRVVDQQSILEEVGETQFNNMYYNGSIRRDSSFNRFSKNNLYWVTKKAAEVYGIPARITLCSGAVVDLVD
jgi:hypothetical protein